MVNLLTIVFCVLIIWRAYKGLRNGFAKEVTRLLSVFIALVILAVTVLLIAGIAEKNSKTIIFSVILLVVIGLVYRLAFIIMKSFETIAELPIISIFNKILGMAAGAVEVLVMFWILYLIIGTFSTGEFGKQIMEWTQQSTILINIYRKNYISNWILGM